MENVRAYRNIKLTGQPKEFERWVSDPRFKEFRVFHNSLYAVSMEQQTVKLNKPIFTGFTVLELSKWLMYDFHYNYIKRKFGPKARLLFTDTVRI